MKNLLDNIWMWGYVIDAIPGGMPYSTAGKTYCSLETAAEYMNVNNIIYMNTRFTAETIKSCHSGGVEIPEDFGGLSDKYFRHVKGYDNVLCALEHGNWAGSAARLSEFSLEHPCVKGAIFDDFRVPLMDETLLPPREVEKVHKALKSKNEKLKLYLTVFSYQDLEEFMPHTEYCDGLTYWNWVPSMDYWQREYFFDLIKLKKKTGKPVIQGMYIHDFGLGTDRPVPLDIFKYTVRKVYNLVRSEVLDGCIIPQNAWFSHEEHMEHIQWLKDYTGWFHATTTRR